MYQLVLIDSFEYLYVILILSMRGSSLYRRQILTYKNGPRAEKVNFSCESQQN